MAKRLRRRSITALLVAAVVGAIGAGTAYAATPANQQYGGVEGVVTGGGGNSGGVAGETAGGTTNSTLPFTGADLGLYASAGLGMIGAGLLLRRAGARRSS
jgi:hypothetical protein